MSPRAVAKPQDAEQRRRALVEANARLDEAEKLRHVVANLREDVVRMEEKRDRLAALGDGRIEIAQESYDQQYGISVTWEPLRSRLTGAELAADLESEIVPLGQGARGPDRRAAGVGIPSTS